MALKSNWSLKLSVDKTVLVLWISSLMLNVFSEFINRWFGGVFNMLLIWLFMFYFVFFYKVKTVNKYSQMKICKYAILIFIVFLLVFIVDFRFIYHDVSIYSSFGADFSNVVWNLFSFVPQVVSALYIITRSDEKDYVLIRNSFIITSVVVFIVSIIVLIDNPTAAKVTATGKSDFIPLFFNYSIIYAFAIAVPFILSRTITGKNRIFMIVYFVLIIYGIFESSFFLAFSAMLLGLCLFMTFSIKKTILRNLTIVLITVSIVLIIGTGYYKTIVLYLVNVIDNVEIKKRISELLIYSETGVAEDTTTRMTMYLNSWKQILKHPILGNIIWGSDCYISGHSTILDIWNGCGGIVLLLFFGFAARIIKINREICERKGEKAALFASTVSLIFVAVFNPIFASPLVVVLWMLAPGMFRSGSLKEIGNDHC